MFYIIKVFFYFFFLRRHLDFLGWRNHLRLQHSNTTRKWFLTFFRLTIRFIQFRSSKGLDMSSRLDLDMVLWSQPSSRLNDYWSQESVIFACSKWIVICSPCVLAVWSRFLDTMEGLGPAPSARSSMLGVLGSLVLPKLIRLTIFWPEACAMSSIFRHTISSQFWEISYGIRLVHLQLYFMYNKINSHGKLFV